MLSNKKYRKLKIVLGVILIVVLLSTGAATYYFNFYEEDLNKHLPMTVTVEPENRDPEDIAYKFWITMMQSYTGDHVSSWEKLTDVRFNEFQLLAGDETEFAVAVTFWAQLEKKNWSTHHSWGDVQEDGTVEDIQWTLRIKKTGENEYTLEQIEETTNTIAGLVPIEDMYQKDAGIAVPDEANRYQIENGKLEVTYDNGDHWKEVPVAIEDLFKGAYNGSKEELIEGSYVITSERTAFVIGEGDNLRVLYTTDNGQTWNESVVPGPLPLLRLRLLGFTSEQNGYLILTGDKTMSSEWHTVFTTNDGGETWKQTGSVQDTNRLVTSGGFINDQVGFISFGSEKHVDQQHEFPSLYRTADGGENWRKVETPIPDEYKGIFTVAQVPTFDGTQGTLLVNQGPNGDYQGGNVLARFISVDEGETWSFANLVDPDNVIE